MGIFVGRGNWVGVWVEGEGLRVGVFSGDEVLGSGFWVGWGVYVVWVRVVGGVRGCSRVGVGDGGSWVLLLSVEDPFVLSALLFALCIDISVEDRGF